jgi:hypothetical protein
VRTVRPPKPAAPRPPPEAEPPETGQLF